MEKQLPKNWVETTLGAVSSKPQYGWTSKSSDSGNIRYLRTTDLSKPSVIWDNVPFCTEEPDDLSKYLLEHNDILISRAGSVGLSYRVDNPPANVVFASYLIRFKPYIDTRIVGYYLHTLAYWEHISDMSAGIAVQNVNAPKLSSLKFPLPPLAEQERIAEKLDALFGQLDSVRGAMNHIPTLLANLRQQILTHAVTGKLTEEWRDGKNLEERQHTTIGTLFSVQTGATPHRENSAYYNYATIPWVKSGEVKNALIFDTDEYISELAVKDTNAKIYPVDTLLIAMYGEGKTRGQVGWLKIPAASNQAIAALVNTNNESTTIHYVYFFCLSQYNEIRSQAKGGNQPNLNLTKIKNWQISLPTIEEQEEIVNRVQSLFEKLDSIEQRYQMLKTKLENLPQAILHKAFKGELVEQLPSDGNATDLLREIEQLKKSLKKK